MSTKSEFLRRYEHTIYRMAIILLQDETEAIEVTKNVLCQLWHDEGFVYLDERKQHNVMIWLVSNAATTTTNQIA
ncbi:MAG TPA: hypothetical protein IAA29_21420 [Candidatus Paenibacillus intestinavium]|nr:hypothetical protein [Candidatus Paenibacillus intestinavium]